MLAIPDVLGKCLYHRMPVTTYIFGLHFTEKSHCHWTSELFALCLNHSWKKQHLANHTNWVFQRHKKLNAYMGCNSSICLCWCFFISFAGWVEFGMRIYSKKWWGKMGLWANLCTLKLQGLVANLTFWQHPNWLHPNIVLLRYSLFFFLGYVTLYFTLAVKWKTKYRRQKDINFSKDRTNTVCQI